MKNTTFAYLNRMKYIEGLMRSIKENIMEHSERVAQLAHILTDNQQ